MVRLLLKKFLILNEILGWFQSHNGAIAASYQDYPKVVQVLLFQSHNGAIAAIDTLLNERLKRMFQSHNGAIAARSPSAECLKGKRVSIPQWCDCCPTVQDFVSLQFYCFNPTMVRLLRLRGILRQQIDYCFNPTMVRLLRVETCQKRLNSPKFQSHNGAIAAGRIQNEISQCWNSFNPTMVRLLLNGDTSSTDPLLSFNPTMVRLLQAGTTGKVRP